MRSTVLLARQLSPQRIFMLSALLVNGGNYLYNLILGRWLGPEAFARAALLITLLLVVAFIGMTVQLTAAKYRSEWDGSRWDRFHGWFRKRALWAGVAIGLAMVLTHPYLASWFHFENGLPFIAFGLGIPLYFGMSFSRGRQQGAQDFIGLSVSYQAEMWARLLLTALLLWLLPSALAVGVGIAASFLFGWVAPRGVVQDKARAVEAPLPADRTLVYRFIGMTALYECSQILINNGDMVLVTHFFDPHTAGQYASLALVGRVVYFVTWMFVMVLLPEVIRQRKNGVDTRPLLMRHGLMVGLFSGAAVLGCFLFPEATIRLLFGEAYLELAGLLGPYALATACFALANLFTYYFLSLDQYTPMWIAAVLGALQITAVAAYHPTLDAVVWLQVGCMGTLLIIQLAYFLLRGAPRA
ncbi:sugar isomerase [Robiginitalea sp. M366]|uniref:sugar isomerase n=1 Tax=Robiginitalea aestuariiviva TaxID=3036903 RepID=UPI00240DCB1F|nr:sugar isomerase [Robiginitalea aestuariiviva]MDG1573368.1 sugar isomerase [Robiginitalea aestuariiviva]